MVAANRSDAVRCSLPVERCELQAAPAEPSVGEIVDLRPGGARLLLAAVTSSLGPAFRSGRHGGEGRAAGHGRRAGLTAGRRLCAVELSRSARPARRARPRRARIRCSTRARRSSSAMLRRRAPAAAVDEVVEVATSKTSIVLRALRARRAAFATAWSRSASMYLSITSSIPVDRLTWARTAWQGCSRPELHEQLGAGGADRRGRGRAGSAAGPRRASRGQHSIPSTAS